MSARIGAKIIIDTYTRGKSVRLDRRRLRCVRRCAKDFADRCERADAHTLDELTTVAGKCAGLQSLTLQIDNLSPGVLGLTEIVDCSGVITISSHCATIQATLFHEIGHLLLGHSHVDFDLALSVLNDVVAPPGFEHTFELLTPEYDPHEVATAEAEAERFAVEVCYLLDAPPGVIREFAYGLG